MFALHQTLFLITCTAVVLPKTAEKRGKHLLELISLSSSTNHCNQQENNSWIFNTISCCQQDTLKQYNIVCLYQTARQLAG